MRDDGVNIPRQGSGRWWTLLTVVALCACQQEDPGPSPKAQYDEVVRQISVGKLMAAYEAILPASYDAELASVVNDFTALFSAEEYDQLLKGIAQWGEQIAGLMSTMVGDSAAEPTTEPTTERLRDLPQALGLGSYQEFQQLSARRLLAALEASSFKNVIGMQSVQEKLGAVQISVNAQQRDWAQVRWAITSDGETTSEQNLDFIRVEGKWIPNDWAVDWPKQIALAREKIAEVAQLKENDPIEFRKRLRRLTTGAAEMQQRLLGSLPALSEALGASPGRGQ